MDENNTGYDTFQNQGAGTGVPQNAGSYRNDSGYQNNEYPGNGYQSNEYPGNGYQNDQYQGNGYQNGGYQNNSYDNVNNGGEYGGNYQNYNGYNNYQPYQQMNQYGDSQLELEEPVKIGEWILSLILMMIPCVNIILMFVFAFSKTEKKSKSNFFKAYLIVCAIWIVLVLIFWFAVVCMAMIGA